MFYYCHNYYYILCIYQVKLLVELNNFWIFSDMGPLFISCAIFSSNCWNWLTGVWFLKCQIMFSLLFSCSPQLNYLVSFYLSYVIPFHSSLLYLSLQLILLYSVCQTIDLRSFIMMQCNFKDYLLLLSYNRNNKRITLQPT